MNVPRPTAGSRSPVRGTARVISASADTPGVAAAGPPAATGAAAAAASAPALITFRRDGRCEAMGSPRRLGTPDATDRADRPGRVSFTSGTAFKNLTAPLPEEEGILGSRCSVALQAVESYAIGTSRVQPRPDEHHTRGV